MIQFNLAQTIEAVAEEVVSLIGKVLRTFRDLLLRPVKFGLALMHPEHHRDLYIPPYTFLVIAGYFGVMVVVEISSWSSLIESFTNNLTGTLKYLPTPAEKLTTLPALHDLLLVGLPILASIVTIASLFQWALLPSGASTLKRLTYYVVAFQFLIVVFIELADYSSTLAKCPGCGHFEPSAMIFRSSWVRSLAIIVPTLYLWMICWRITSDSHRRFGRYFPFILPVASTTCCLATYWLLSLGSQLYLRVHPLNLEEHEVARLILVNEPRLDGSSLTIDLLLESRLDRELVVRSTPAVLFLADYGEWRGGLLRDDDAPEIVQISGGSKTALRFRGSRIGEENLPEETAGRLDLVSVEENSNESPLVSYSWRRTIPVVYR